MADLPGLRSGIIQQSRQAHTIDNATACDVRQIELLHIMAAKPVLIGVVMLIQQISELMAVPGVDIVGPLPPGCNTTVVFAASCFAGAGTEAERFIAWLADAMTPEALRAAGLAPA